MGCYGDLGKKPPITGNPSHDLHQTFIYIFHTNLARYCLISPSPGATPILHSSPRPSLVLARLRQFSHRLVATLWSGWLYILTRYLRIVFDSLRPFPGSFLFIVLFRFTTFSGIFEKLVSYLNHSVHHLKPHRIEVNKDIAVIILSFGVWGRAA